MKKFYQMNTNDDGTNELLIYGDITSYKWYEGDVCSYDLAKEMSSLEGPIKVRINSYGGEVSQGLAIHNLLKDYKGEVTTMCDGFACSAASIIFMAGSKRVMPKSSLLLIHNAWSYASGDSNALKKAAEDLEKITYPSVEIYKSVSNLSEEKIKEMMDREEWITADEALSYGFATDIKNDSANQSMKENYFQNVIMENKSLKYKLSEAAKNAVIDYEKIANLVNKKIKENTEEKHTSKQNGWDAFFNSRKKEEN